jgi:hypothetical protein
LYYNSLVWIRRASALGVAARGFLLLVWRITRQTFHEVTGALFVLLAVVGATSVWRQWRRGSAEWLIFLSAALTASMAWFALAAFRSARRVR